MKKAIVLMLVYVFSQTLFSQSIHFQLKTKLEGYIFKPDSLDIYFYDYDKSIRLKATDSFDLNYLDVANETTKSENIALKINNNIAGNTLSFTLENDNNSKGIIGIYDVSGNCLLSKEADLAQGLNNLNFDISNLNNGIYFLNIKTNNNNYSAKFIKLGESVNSSLNTTTPIKPAKQIQNTQEIKVTAYLKTFKPHTFDEIFIAGDTNLVLVMANRTLGKVKSIYSNIKLTNVTLYDYIYYHAGGGSHSSKTIYNQNINFYANERINYSSFDSNSISFQKDYGLLFFWNENSTSNLIFNFEKMSSNLLFNYETEIRGQFYLVTNADYISWKINDVKFYFDSMNNININFSGIENRKKSFIKSIKEVDVYQNSSYASETNTYTPSLNDDTDCSFSLTIEFE